MQTPGMFVFQGAQPCSMLSSPSVWRRRSWQCVDTPPVRTFLLILWPYCHRKRSWISRKFRWLPQVCGRDLFSASEPCSDFGIHYRILTQTCSTRVSRNRVWEIFRVSQVNLMQSQVKLPNMVVQCTACATTQGSSAATIKELAA